MSLISSIFGTEPSLASKTVDGVMSAFHDTIAKLEDVASHHSAKVVAHDVAIEALELEKAASAAEAKLAAEIASKLASIVGKPQAPAESVSVTVTNTSPEQTAAAAVVPAAVPAQ
jgi:hypothetical protein